MTSSRESGNGHRWDPETRTHYLDVPKGVRRADRERRGTVTGLIRALSDVELVCMHARAEAMRWPTDGLVSELRRRRLWR